MELLVVLFQSVTHQNGVNAMSLKKVVLKTEPSALRYKLPTAYLIGQTGLTGAPAHSTQLETVYRQGRELVNVVKRWQILLSVSHHCVTAVSNFCVNILLLVLATLRVHVLVQIIASFHRSIFFSFFVHFYKNAIASSLETIRECEYRNELLFMNFFCIHYSPKANKSLLHYDSNYIFVTFATVEKRDYDLYSIQWHISNITLITVTSVN